MLTLPFKRTDPLAKIPTRGSNSAAGYDLCSTENYTLKPLERKLFKTGLSIEIPTGLYGRVAPRSGLAYKDGLDVMAGVIDEDYRGDVGVILINLGSVEKRIVMGDKIAQIIFENYNVVSLVELESLSVTARNDGGFGSTDEANVIKIRAAQPTIVEPTEMPNRKYDVDKPFSQTGKSSILEKWKSNVQTNDAVSYEKLVKERETPVQ
jgi:dUTP pyrophosphatase